MKVSALILAWLSAKNYHQISGYLVCATCLPAWLPAFYSYTTTQKRQVTIHKIIPKQGGIAPAGHGPGLINDGG